MITVEAMKKPLNKVQKTQNTRDHRINLEAIWNAVVSVADVQMLKLWKRLT